MITGRKSYVVAELDDETVVALYGPFATEEDASEWEGMPGGPSSPGGSYRVLTLYSPPQWFEAWAVGDPAEDDAHAEAGE